MELGRDEFSAEIFRIQNSGVLGERGRLRELFDYFAGRGHDYASASQAEIAQEVFGLAGAESDDATVRVYVHRLRKRLDSFYASDGSDNPAVRLHIPPGTYAMRFARTTVPARSATTVPPWRFKPALLLFGGAALVLAALAAGWMIGQRGAVPQSNAMWRPFIASDRPLLIVVGDYYMFGEIDPMAPEKGRLIREFSINSATDLAQAEDVNPERYAAAEDMGLNYLPLSSAYALEKLMPILARHKGRTAVIPSSKLTADDLQEANVVYLGLYSGMGLLESMNFRRSQFRIGQSYDEMQHVRSGRHFTSEEAVTRPSSRYYHDYGYASVFLAPGGNLVATIAGARDTGLRGVAQLVSAPELPDKLEKLAEDGRPFETLIEITGQQGADLTSRILLANSRP